MKRINKNKAFLWTAIAALPLIVIGCLKFIGNNQPERALTGSDLVITTNLQVDKETDGAGNLVYGIYAPKSWNLAQNATLSLTTKGDYWTSRGENNITDEPLTLVAANEKDEAGAKVPWAEAFTTVTGVGDNDKLDIPVEMEWVVWKSTTSFNINGDKTPLGDVTIKLKVGDESVSCNLGYAYCYTGHGLQKDARRDGSMFKKITTYGEIAAYQPEEAHVTDQINVKARLNVIPETNGSGKLVFAILAPKNWKLDKKASLSVTAFGKADDSADMTDEALTLMPDSEQDPNTNTSWPEAFKAVAGIGDNSPESAEDLEWTVWRSSKTLTIDEARKYVFADLNIKLMVGRVAGTYSVGYACCFDTWGVKADAGAIGFMPITTTGVAIVCSTTPSVLRYGDIFAVQFKHEATALEDAPEAYLCGTATYNGGEVAEVTTTGDFNRMDVASDLIFEKYIYPKQFFNLPADAVIEKLDFYFSNADGTAIVKDELNDDNNFVVEQTEEAEEE